MSTNEGLCLFKFRQWQLAKLCETDAYIVILFVNPNKLCKYNLIKYLVSEELRDLVDLVAGNGLHLDRVVVQMAGVHLQYSKGGR